MLGMPLAAEFSSPRSLLTLASLGAERLLSSGHS
jgi:hypothetical protein